MITEKQDPQKPATQDAPEKPPYERLPRVFQQLVDKMVENRGRLLLGYKEMLDGAKQGRPINGEALDTLQEEYTEKLIKHQGTLTSYFKVSAQISDFLQSYTEGQAEPNTKSNFPIPSQQSKHVEPVKVVPLDGQTEDKSSTPEEDKKNSEKSSNSLFRVDLKKMLTVAKDFDKAMGDKMEAWDEAHRDELRGLNIRSLNTALLKQSRKDGKLPRENIKLNPETKDTEGLLKDLLSKNPGIAITDVHIFDDSFAMVEKHMGALKQSGVDTIYIEHDPDWVRKVAGMSQEDMQTLKNTGKFRDISIRTAEENASHYKFHTSEDMYGGMLSMIESAKKHGIAVKGMDEYPAAAGRGVPSWRRIGMSNAIWVDNIQKDRESLPEEERNSGKYVVIGGMMHFVGDGIVDERLGLPTIGFTKIAHPGQPEIQATNTAAFPDFLISSEGYINTHKLLRADSFEQLSNGLKELPLPLGAALLARGAAAMAMKQAKSEMEALREEFKKDRPPTERDINDLLWKGIPEGDIFKTNPPPADPHVKDKMILKEDIKPGNISEPLDVKEGEIKSPQGLPQKSGKSSAAKNQ